MLALVSLAFSLGVPLFIGPVSASPSSSALTPTVVQALNNDDTLPRLCTPVNGLNQTTEHSYTPMAPGEITG